MTEFEQQVAQALAAFAGIDSEYDHDMRVIQVLAPSVAAALDRLARMYVDDVHGGDDDSERYRAVLGARREDGLAALRGQPT